MRRLAKYFLHPTGRLFARLTDIEQNLTVMPAASPQDETIALIAKITEDGVLDTEEVYELAEFLNENEEACLIWPGDVLHEALSSAFDDGRLTDEEMAELARLIQDIEMEAKESEEQTVWMEPLKPETPRYDVVELKAPSIKGKEAKGKNAAGEKYAANLESLSCSCEDWQTKRSQLPEGSPGRLCSCLVAELNKEKESQPEVNAVFSWLLGERTQRGKGMHPVEFYNLIVMDDGTALVSFGSSKWAHVLVPLEEAAYERFGFNFADRRWAYNRKPYGFQPVKEYINTIEIEA